MHPAIFRSHCTAWLRQSARRAPHQFQTHCTASLQRRTLSTIPVSHGEPRRPFRLAVIGSGPGGFYAAYRVLSKIEGSKVDMYERLPVPYGLVRFGVAPDHPEVKNCEEKFEEVASSPRFNFIGNVAVGSALPLTALKPHYDALLFAYGASEDKDLGIPGESNLKGIYSARAFVGWYNGLPEYAHLAPNLEAGEDAVVIGQGNVALDVARVLLSDVDSLRKTDMTSYALDTLQKSRVKRVRVIGRRGPMQAAFTIKELRELLTLPSVSFEPVDSALFPPEATKLPRAQKRIVQLIQKYSNPTPASAPASSSPGATDGSKNWGFRFLLSPTAFESSSSSSDQLSQISFANMTLDGSENPFDPAARPSATGESTTLPANLAFRSIGYKSVALPGLADLKIPFDDRRGFFPNDLHGRVIDPASGPAGALTAAHVPGIYCAGWVKRGPTGVIASTMQDAFSTADVIALDWEQKARFLNSEQPDGKATSRDGWDAVKEEAQKRGLRPVSWADWQRIDQAEKEKGQKAGKIREKFGSVPEMLSVLD